MNSDLVQESTGSDTAGAFFEPMMVLGEAVMLLFAKAIRALT